MSEKEFCSQHSGCIVRMDNFERQQRRDGDAILAAHRRVDVMKNWVIAGMTSLILNLIVMIGGFIVLLNRG